METRIWRLMAHHEDPSAAIAWTKRNHRIAIGWGFVGDLRNYDSPEQIAEVIKQAFLRGEHLYDNAPEGGRILWDLREAMQIGDLVILNGSLGRELVVEVTGDYHFIPEPLPIIGTYQHQRAVRVTGWDPEKIWKATGAKPVVGYSPRWTLFPMLKTLDLDEV